MDTTEAIRNIQNLRNELSTLQNITAGSPIMIGALGEGASFSGSMMMGGPTQVAAQGIRQEPTATAAAPQTARVAAAPTQPEQYSYTDARHIIRAATDDLIQELYGTTKTALERRIHDTAERSQIVGAILPREREGAIRTDETQSSRFVRSMIAEQQPREAPRPVIPPPEAPPQPAGQQVPPTTVGTSNVRTNVTILMPLEFSQQIADNLKNAVIEMLHGTLTPILGQLGDVQAMVRRIAKSDSHMGGGG